jgi:hypothetical protein
MSAALNVGDEAWAIVETPATPSGRRTVLGAALVRVEAIEGDDVHVEVLRGSGVPVGIAGPRQFQRRDLFARRDRIEHAAFGDLVRKYWGGRP